MDIHVALTRSFVYTILIFLISILYFSTTRIAEIYLNELTGYKSFIFSFLCASITALAFVPLQNILQKFIDRLFLKKSVEEIETENKLLKQEIIQTERLKSVAILASGMAHEIKNPLTLLKTFSEFLPNRLDDKEFLKKFSPMVANEINRIDELVHNLLDFAKPAPPALKATDIHQLLNHTLDLLSNDLIKHHIQCVRRYQVDGTCLDIDPKQISQAVLNIVLNAIDAMPGGGTLTVATELPLTPSLVKRGNGGVEITIKIQDTGYGIKPEHLPHIFDPFFTQKDEGTGLGLSITHEIIRNHKGKIFVESQAGKGTTFIIELPC